MPVRQPVVQIAEVLAADRSRRRPCRRGACRPARRGAAVPRRATRAGARGPPAHARRPASPPRGPHGEDERQPGPVLPRLAEVDPNADTLPAAPRAAAPRRRSRARASCGNPARARQVGRLRPRRREVGAHAPSDGGRAARAAAPTCGRTRVSSTRAAVQLGQRPPGEERHAVHRAVAGDGEVGQQMVRRGVARVLHGRDDADVELARRPAGR